MAHDELRRTNIQALWRYMPNQPYHWSSQATVVGTNPRQVSDLEVPEQWVSMPLRRLIRPFAEAASGTVNAGPELDVIDRGHFRLVKAEDLRAERFPNTFLCERCGRFTTVRVGEAAPTCAQHGAMEQFPFVEVHECGRLAQLRPPHCVNGCRASMGLFNTDKFSVSSWYWRCSRCRTRVDRPVAVTCASCRRGRVSVNRAAQSSSYYAQQITIINPPTRSGYAALAHDQVHAAAIAQALGVLPAGLDGLRLAGGAQQDAVAAFEAVAKQLGWGPGNALYEAGLAEAQAKAGSAPAWREQVDELGLDPEHLEALGDECRQLSLARGSTSLSVEDLAAESVGTPFAPLYQTYRPLFGQYGFTEVTLLRQLPVAYIVAGYTRLMSTASAMNRYGSPVTPKFQFFPAGKSGKIQMFGLRTETEGLLFQLDPVRIVAWLVESGIVDDPGVTDAEAARRWLFRVADPVTDVFNAPENRITRAVLGLTHSVAHRAMKALAARCGLNVDSLAEYLFPLNGAFLIYANTRSEFILGGLEHVFRYDLADALSDLDAESRCVFDPPCRHSFGGACAACLYVSEVACARFNTVLDRNLLFGSLAQAADNGPAAAGAGHGGEVQWRGYWSP